MDLPPPPPRERVHLDLPGGELPYERPALYERPSYSERDYDRFYGREVERRVVLSSASHSRYDDSEEGEVLGTWQCVCGCGCVWVGG